MTTYKNQIDPRELILLLMLILGIFIMLLSGCSNEEPKPPQYFEVSVDLNFDYEGWVYLTINDTMYRSIKQDTLLVIKQYDTVELYSRNIPKNGNVYYNYNTIVSWIDNEGEHIKNARPRLIFIPK